MNFNAPICPLLHLFLFPLPLPFLHSSPSFLQHHHYLHPIFPEGRIKRWGSCVSVCVCHMCECKVVVRRGRRRVGGGGGGLHFSFPSCASLTQLPLHPNPHPLHSLYLSFSPSILLSSSVLCCSPLLLTSALTLGSGSKWSSLCPTHTHRASRTQIGVAPFGKRTHTHT